MASENTYQFVLEFLSENLKELKKDIEKTNQDLGEFETAGEKAENATEQLDDSSKKLNETLEERIKKAQEHVRNINNESNANKKLEGSLGGVFKKLFAIGSIYAFAHKAMNFYNEGLELDTLSKKTGILRDELQNLSQAGKAFNISSETTASSITKAQEYYKKNYGVSVSGETAYEAIAKKMEGMGSKAQYEFGASIGLDEGTIDLLSQGVEKYKKQLKEAQNYKLYDEDDINKLREYRQSMSQLRLGLNQMVAIVSRALLPVVNAILKPIGEIFKFLSKHEGLVKTIALYAGLAGVLVGLPKIIGMISGAWKLLNAGFLASPIGWLVAGLTALILLVNDFINFLQGNDSVIGRLFTKWGLNVEEIRKKCNNFFQGIADWVDKVISGFKKVADAFKLLGKAKQETESDTTVNTHDAVKGDSKLYSTFADKPKNMSTLADSPYNNTKNISNNKNIKIENVNIQTQNMSPADIKNSISSIDNGIRG